MSTDDNSPTSWLARERCNVYLWDVANATDTHLPPKYTPHNWLANKFSAELWVQRALVSHPWRVAAPEDADLILLAANFSMYCRAGKSYSARFFWRKLLPLMGYTGKPTPLLRAPALGNATARTPKLLVLTDNECTSPTSHTWKPREVLGITDHGPGAYDAVAPFVLSRPPWLVAAGAADQSAAQGAWDARPLVFFTGHVPKLYINPTRYLIWKQIRRAPGVTALSATINCTIGQFAACRAPPPTDAGYKTFCLPYCDSHREDDWRVALNDAPGRVSAAKGPPKGVRRGGRGCSSKGAFHRNCRAYRHVNFTDEAAEMAAATRNLPAPKYFEAAMSHRFCLNAPGDFVSTPKITEFVALGAAGGCLPVMVVRGAPQAMLPYARWLDWCAIAVLVSEETARAGMGRVLARLRATTAADAAAMRARLRAARDAFVWRPPAADPVAQPSAADFVLGEACESARKFRAHEDKTGATSARPPAPDPRRCML